MVSSHIHHWNSCDPDLVLLTAKTQCAVTKEQPSCHPCSQPLIHFAPPSIPRSDMEGEDIELSIIHIKAPHRYPSDLSDVPSQPSEETKAVVELVVQDDLASRLTTSDDSASRIATQDNLADGPGTQGDSVGRVTV